MGPPTFVWDTSFLYFLQAQGSHGTPVIFDPALPLDVCDENDKWPIHLPNYGPKMDTCINRQIRISTDFEKLCQNWCRIFGGNCQWKEIYDTFFYKKSLKRAHKNGTHFHGTSPYTSYMYAVLEVSPIASKFATRKVGNCNSSWKVGAKVRSRFLYPKSS